MAFRCIAMDPPWLERGGGKSKRGADRHYPLMSKVEIFNTLMECEYRAEFRNKSSCHLWAWATSNFLTDALWLMQVLGFKYKTNAVWVKTNDKGTPAVGMQIGLGQYMRHCHEWLLLGTRGDAMVPKPEDRPPSVVFAPRTRHSAKPAAAYQMIERVSPGPRLEMFARKPRDGWVVWGNEV